MFGVAGFEMVTSHTTCRPLTELHRNFEKFRWPQKKIPAISQSTKRKRRVGATEFDFCKDRLVDP